MKKLAGCVIIITLLSPFSLALEKRALKSFDGYKLEYNISPPGPKSTPRVVILLHGSGPQDMDENLTSVSSGTTNLFFADIAAALAKRGFTIIRYNKRSYQWMQKIASDPASANSKRFQRFSADPLKYTIQDAKATVKFARKTFPNAKIYLLGHSEGAFIALQLADLDRKISGVGLIGFSSQPLDVLLFEQTVYRPMYIFEILDSNHNLTLEKEELASNQNWGAIILPQMQILDLNKNGKIDKYEYMAGNLTNILEDAPSIAAYRRREATYKRPADIIRDASCEIVFFHGDLDNQTPVYNSLAIQLMNSMVWKKPNIHFHFFKNLGHALDKRNDINDLIYRPADTQALTDMAHSLDTYWKSTPRD